MKRALRISVKEYRQGKPLKTQLSQASFGSSRQFLVKMNGSPWPLARRPVSITRVLTALRKSIVKAMPSKAHLSRPALSREMGWRFHNTFSGHRVLDCFPANKRLAVPVMKALARLLLLSLTLACNGTTLRAQELPAAIAENFYPPELVRLAYPALNLTDEQKDTLQSADEKISERLAQMKKALAQETAKLAAMVKAEQLDNDAIMAQADKVLGLEQDGKRATLALLLKIRETLSPEQLAKLKEFKARTAAFQPRMREAMALAQKWKQQGRDLSAFDQARSEFEALMGAGQFQAAEALLDKTLKRLQAPVPEPNK